MTERIRPQAAATLLLAASALFLANAGARAQSDGDLDIRYGTGGFARSLADRSVNPPPDAVAGGPDGHYVKGSRFFFPDAQFLASRLDSAGTFEVFGYAVFDVGGTLEDVPTALAVQADGSVVQVGWATDSATPGNSRRAAIARYTEELADLDTSFSGDGKDTVNFVGDATSYAVAIAPDGRIVVAGCYETNTASGLDVFVLRYTAAGVLDSSFDLNGIKTFGIDNGGNQDDCARAVLVQGDGKIVVAGSAQYGVGDQDFMVARLTTTGALDPTFGEGSGFTTIAFDLGGETETALAIAMDGRGRFVVAGEAHDASDDRTAIARLLANGTLDFQPGSFATSGKYAPDDNRGLVLGLAVAGPPSNRIYYLTLRNWIGALTPTGVLDASFSGDGFVPFDDPLAGTTLQAARAITFDGGMLVLGGDSTAGTTHYDIVARYWIRQIFGDGFESGGTGLWLGW